MYKIGLIYSWGSVGCAESELLRRFKIAARNIGAEIVPMNAQGAILDENNLPTLEYVNEKELLFIISMHYCDAKFCDAFYYYTVWNPPEIPLGGDDYRYVIDNIISYDDFLIYDENSMRDHLQSMLIDYPRTLKNHSTLLGSFPKSEILTPNLDNPKLFYCGSNWEGHFRGQNRHVGLFKLLDNEGIVRFYGPEVVPEWNNYKPWEGYQSYAGEIPFDGVSLIRKCNECGIVLALSSDMHRRAGAVTNRVYEACAAGCVIISDDNPFMKKHFKDSVLYIDFNKENPKDTLAQIKEKYEWIICHQKEALELAFHSQQLFCENYCMEVGLKNVIDRHSLRVSSHINDVCSCNVDNKILAVYVINHYELDDLNSSSLKNILTNVKKQQYTNIDLVIACDKRIQKAVEACVAKQKQVYIETFNIYNSKNSKILGQGEILYSIISKYPHHYLTLPEANNIWFHDHITILSRLLEDSGDEYIAAVARRNVIASDNNIYCEKNNLFSLQELYECKESVLSSQVLIKAAAEKYIIPAVYRSLDGYELNAILLRAAFTYNKKLIYSPYSTSKYDSRIAIPKHLIMSEDKQIRLVRGLVQYQYEIWSRNHLQIQQQTIQSPTASHNEVFQPYKIKYFLFNCIPLFVVKRKVESVKIMLGGGVPLLTIKYKNNKKRYKLFNLLTIMTVKGK